VFFFYLICVFLAVQNELVYLFTETLDINTLGT